MIIYENLKKGFLDDVESGEYVNKVKNAMETKMHRHSGKSEENSWVNSLRAMSNIMQDNNIPEDAGIAIEYNIPNTSNRVDFIITGYDSKNKEEIIFIELKQWSKINKVGGMDQIVETFLGKGLRQIPHPSYQVWSYTELLKNSNEYIQNNGTKLSPCAYMHNYYPIEKDDPILDFCYKQMLEKAPVFRMTESKELKQFIKNHIKYGDKLLSLKNIEKGKLHPSKSLQDCLANMLRNKPEFVMIDEQKVIYEQVLKNARLSQKDKKKRVIIVKGGPGTGKTVVAINLLVQSIQENIYSSYVTKNSAPREVFFNKLRGESYKPKFIKGLFMGSGSFISCPLNKYGLLICDEAHRLNGKSGMFSNLGENQIKEIINASLTSVFFIDEEQIVTSKDIGSIKEIEKWALREGAKLQISELVSQFRCGGSDGYISWLDNILQIRETANYSLENIPYDFQVIDDPNELRKLIETKNQIDGKARMVAGYCWDWVSKKEETLNDISLGNFSMQWNLNNRAPFAIDPGSINQIGCIHTCQGLEFSYVGVIIGNDIRFEKGKVVTDFTKRAKTDQSLKGLISKARKGDLETLSKIDIIIKNTYRTLMSRGMKGCFIYCCDKNLKEYIKASIVSYNTSYPFNKESLEVAENHS